MRVPTICLLSLAFLVGLLMSFAAPASDVLKERAQRWEWSLPDNKNKDLVKGHTFTGWIDGGLTVGGKPGTAQDKRPKLGQWKLTGPGEVTMTITKEDHPLFGTIEVKQTQGDPKPAYEGTLTHGKGGEKEKIVFKLFKD